GERITRRWPAGQGRRAAAGGERVALIARSQKRRERTATMGVQESEQLWGGETTKAVGNFPVSGETVPVPVIRWLGRIKGAAARVNAELDLLDGDLAERIAASADRVAD